MFNAFSSSEELVLMLVMMTEFQGQLESYRQVLLTRGMGVNVAVLVTSLVRVALTNQPTSESLSLVPKVSCYLVFFNIFISPIAGSNFQALSGSQYHAIRRTSVARVQTTSHVFIKKIICELDINDFATSFVSTNEVIDGFIHDAPFSSGAMKYAFDVRHFYLFSMDHHNHNLLPSVYHKVW
jgi:hypothetical protein